MKKSFITPVVLAILTILAVSCNVSEKFSSESSLAENQISETRAEALADVSEIQSKGSTKVVAIVWDGFQNQKLIDEAFYSAIGNVSGWSQWRKYWLPGSYDISDTKNRVNDLVNVYGVPKSELVCLLVGKSLGGAKTYKMMADNESFFDDFAKVSVVLVDPHEPGAPGDEGRSNYWYDYVRFRDHSSDWNGHYDLAWQSVWNDLNGAGRLGFYSIYQRGSWPRGYKFSSAKICWSSGYDHYAIANCSSTVSLMQYALNFILN